MSLTFVSQGETALMAARSVPSLKTTTRWLRVMRRNKHTYTSFFTANTFFRTLHIIQTHSKHLFRETRPRLSVLDAQIKTCRSTKTKQSSGGLGQKNDMVPFTSLLQTSSLQVPLCLLYPAHPRAFPNQHSFPSNSAPPPSHTFNTNTTARQEWKNVGKRSTSFFWSSHSDFNITVQHLSPTTTWLVLIKYPITYMHNSSWL